MGSIRFEILKNKPVFIIDYTNSSESQMIETIKEAKRLIFQKNEPVLILAIFDDKIFITPNFMKVAIHETKEVINLIEKQAIVGLSPVKKLILKGYNFTLNRNIQSYDTKEEALNFLLDDATSDKETRW